MAASDQNPMRIVDVHRHCLGAVLGAQLPYDSTGKYHVGTIKGVSSVFYDELMDIDGQIKGQDEGGVTKGILSFSMMVESLSDQFNKPWLEIAQRLNDETAQMVVKYPTKLDFLAMVNPLDKACVTECERCIKQHGAKGISVESSWQGRYLDTPEAYPLWEFAQDQDAVVFIHPPQIPIGYQQMNIYRLEEAVGRPFDTAMNIARMIYSGVFDRFPKLKVVLVHMGGGLPMVLGRFDFCYRLGYDGLPAGQAAVCKRKPSEYLGNIWVDTMGFSPAGIRHALALFGPDRVLFGSDYPAVPINPKEQIDIVKGLGLSQEDQEKIFWNNAARLYKLAA